MVMVRVLGSSSGSTCGRRFQNRRTGNVTIWGVVDGGSSGGGGDRSTSCCRSGRGDWPTGGCRSGAKREGYCWCYRERYCWRRVEVLRFGAGKSDD